MNQAYFEKWSDLTKKVQEPLLALTELNIKTLQSMTYLKPEELTKIRKPEEMMDKQINLMVENSHKALDYLQKSFQIWEKAMFSYVDEAKKAQDIAKK